ncbi:MAG TPA: Abi family protein [Anseongella sp.]
MPKVPYTKPALNYADQLQRLKSRGLIIENDKKALHLLQNISYYRLSGYWYPLLEAPKHAHQFKPGSTFENAFSLYCFDRELRKLISGELEKIEVAVRAKMIYTLWHSHDAFWYQNPSLFTNRNKAASTIKKLRKENVRSDEEFVKAFNDKYSDPLPPACIILEISSFGNLSAIYSNLKPGRNKRKIANDFGVDDRTFASWLHSLTYVRNICAHHSRLWNKEMGISPRIPTKPQRQFLNKTMLPNPDPGRPPILNNNKAYFLLSIVIYLLDIINPKHSFKKKLNQLFRTYPMADLKAMGFPSEWEREPLWNGSEGQ